VAALAALPRDLRDAGLVDKIAARTGLGVRQLGGQLTALRKGAPPKATPAAAERRPRRAPLEGDRPEVGDGADVNHMTSAAERALLTRHAAVFSRGGQLVRIRRVARGVVIEGLPAPSLAELLSEHVLWTRPAKDGPYAVKPPRAVVDALLARGTWSLREITALAEAPCLAPDGRVLAEDGWHESGVYVALEGRHAYPPVPAQPTREDANKALVDLFAPFAEFPFVEPCDESAALALVLTLVARPAIGGPIPLFLVRGPVAGSGKGKVVHVAAACAFGREAAVSPPEKDPAEERKSLLALGAEGAPLALLDNLEHALGSDVLAAALTAPTFRARELGKTRTLEVRLPVLAATGNNLQVKGDLARRCVPIDLDPKIEQPEGRVFEREQPAWALEHHPRLVAAALTALRGFVLAGRPRPAGLAPYGSFEAWDRLVRCCLLWAGIADPCGGRERLRAEADTGLAELDAALCEWRRVSGGNPWSVRQMIGACEGQDGEALREALAGLCRVEPRKLTTGRLGYALRTVAKRVVRGLRFEADAGGHARRWSVVGDRDPGT
jgi:putative DNA primase/helicase